MPLRERILSKRGEWAIVPNLRVAANVDLSIRQCRMAMNIDWETPFEQGNGNQTATWRECIAFGGRGRASVCADAACLDDLAPLVHLGIEMGGHLSERPADGFGHDSAEA